MDDQAMTVEQRFFSYIESVDDCWIWGGTRDGKGYGSFSIKHRYHRAHRVCYEFLLGPIPEGHDLDHLCRNPLCVNVGHLEPVTRLENSMRGEHPNYVAHRNGTCRVGHPRSQMYFRKSNGRPVYCKVCAREKYLKRLGRTPRRYKPREVAV